MTPQPWIQEQAAPTESSRAIRILLVDDDPDNLLSLEATLDGLADEIVLASSGAEALRRVLSNDEFAAILLDVKMPEMDGFEAAQLIRSRKKNQHTPILFLTAYRSDDQLFRGYDLGAVDFLFKPLIPEILRSKVAVFVQLARNAQLLRRQAEVLAKAEMKFRSLLDSAPDATIITHESGEIARVNLQCQQLFGCPGAELLGRNLRDLVPVWSAGAHLLGGDQFGVRQDKTAFPAEISISPLMTEDGLLYINVIRDITERRNAEERILALNFELEQKVAERTADLVRSNDALREFAWAASHDLQEPLRMVITFTELLEEQCGHLDGEGRLYLDYVKEGGLRLHRLLGGLRECIQLSEDAYYHLTNIDSSAVVKQALANLTEAVDNSKAEITCDSLPVVPASETLLTQLFQNLLSNALKYRAEAPPRIQIAAERSGALWVFSVRDNGIGIAPAYHDRIFGVFKRLHRDRYPGSGIGLAICKTVVERLGGRIWVESDIGCGSTFYFTIPATCDQVKA